MDTGTMIRELNNVAEKHSNDKLHTFDTNISAMCMDIIPKLEKLAEYEDMEEQGRLVKFPCKVGDTVYVLVEMDDNGKYTRVKNDVVKSFYISPDNIPMIEFTYIWHDTYINDFGKSVFLTREQAEQALKQERS